MKQIPSVNGITEGVIWKQILKFFFPILFGTLFQQLYNTADAVIVGNFLGKEALAAVGGGTATITNLLIGFFIGLSTGATVIISQYFGAKSEEKVSAAVHNAAALAIVSGIIVTVAGYFSSEWMLRAIKTPEDIFPYALQYMHIYFLGASLNVIFNIGSGIFRAFGDSRRPLYFLIVSCLVNIVLDLVFVGLFGWGIKGAAYATVLSQFVASAMVVLFLAKRDDCCKLCLSKIRFNSFMLKKTLYIGFPGGIQSIMFSLSNLLLQSSINYFGTDTAAAWAAYGRLDSIYWLIINAMGVSVTTFVGQNYGAGYMDRARKGVRTSILISMAGTLFMEAFFLLFGRQLFLLFTSDEKVIEIGLEMLNTIAPFFFTFIGVEILSAATRGAGKAIIPTLISIFGICILRIIWIETVSGYFGTLRSVIAVYPFSWIVTSILFIAYYLLGNIFPKETKNPDQE